MSSNDISGFSETIMGKSQSSEIRKTLDFLSFVEILLF